MSTESQCEVKDEPGRWNGKFIKSQMEHSSEKGAHEIPPGHPIVRSLPECIPGSDRRNDLLDRIKAFIIFILPSALPVHDTLVCLNETRGADDTRFFVLVRGQKERNFL